MPKVFAVLLAVLGSTTLASCGGCESSDPQAPDAGHDAHFDEWDSALPDHDSGPLPVDAATDSGPFTPDVGLDDDGGPSPEPHHYDVCGTFQVSGPDGDCDGELTRDCQLTVRDTIRLDYQEVIAGDSNCDGEADGACRVTLWDPASRTQRSGSDDDCDGALDSFCNVTTFAEDRTELDAYVDLTCDGRDTDDESCRTAEYDESTHTVSYLYEPTCDGTEAYCTIVTQDPDSTLTREENRDGSCTGPFVSCTERERIGNTATWTQDIGCDGVLEHCHTVELMATGLIGELVESEEQDDGCDGPSAGDVCITYSGDNELDRRAARDDDCNGSVDSCGGADAFFEGDNLVRQEVYDGPCDAPATCIDYQHDALGNQTGKIVDVGCDGVFESISEECVTAAYDDRGVVSETVDVHCDHIHCATTSFRSDACR